MGVNTSLYWLGCDNYYKNTYTLILPAEGELKEIHGVKTSDHDWRLDPYSSGEDMAPYLKGAKRIVVLRCGSSEEVAGNGRRPKRKKS